MTAHRWYRPPIPDPPMICFECGARWDTPRGDAPCDGEPPDHEPLDLTPGAERLMDAWHEHEEAHR